MLAFSKLRCLSVRLCKKYSAGLDDSTGGRSKFGAWQEGLYNETHITVFHRSLWKLHWGAIGQGVSKRNTLFWWEWGIQIKGIPLLSHTDTAGSAHTHTHEHTNAILLIPYGETPTSQTHVHTHTQRCVMRCDCLSRMSTRPLWASNRDQSAC